MVSKASVASQSGNRPIKTLNSGKEERIKGCGLCEQISMLTMTWNAGRKKEKKKEHNKNIHCKKN